MKFSPLVTLLPLLLSSSLVFATMGRDVIRARQAHVKKDLLDVCVALDVDVNINPAGINILAGHIDICLCLSVLPGFLNSNPVAQNCVNHLGANGALNYFTNLIQSQKNKQQCHYPAHATPFCSVQHPCGFNCGDGYTPFPSNNPTQCVCNAPHTECNGVCGSFPRGCSSQGVSKNLKRDQLPICPAGKTMCGVPNGGGVDCVNIDTDKESCGGCTVGLGSSSGNNAAGGKNCKAIPNVDNVLCDQGTCKVLSCKGDFDPSPAGNSCLKRRLNRVRQTRGVEVIDDTFDRLTSLKLLVNGFDIVLAKAQILSSLSILDYNHVLQFLLDQRAIVGAPSLFQLRNMLGLDASVLRRDAPSTVDGVLDILLVKGLIIGCTDLPCIKGLLGVDVEAFTIDHLLQVLVAQFLVVGAPDLAQLKDILGLGVQVL